MDAPASALTGALARGLAVLRALNDVETGTIGLLVAETRLSKATVIRLLQTLVQAGYAEQDPETQTYRVTRRVASLSRGLVLRDAEDEAVRTVLDELAETLKWPTEFIVPDGNSMVIRINNRARAPIKLRLFERSRFPLLASAAGVVHLASLDQRRRDEMIARHAVDAGQREDVRARVERAAAEGFALRSYPELAPNMQVVSVAVPGGRGALSTIHFDDVVPLETVRSRFVPTLTKAAQAIAKAEPASARRAES